MKSLLMKDLRQSAELDRDALRAVCGGIAVGEPGPPFVWVPPMPALPELPTMPQWPNFPGPFETPPFGPTVTPQRYSMQ